MRYSTIKRQPASTNPAERIPVPHSSWTRADPPASSPKRLPPEEFWARLGL